MEKIVRVDIDSQYGFTHPAGGLYVKNAEKVVGNIAYLNNDAQVRGFPIIGSVDTHESNSPEFLQNGGIWPVHCVKGTFDWLKEPMTLPQKFVIVGDAPVRSGKTYSKPVEAFDPNVAVYFEKDIYSLFDNVNAYEIVKHYVSAGYRFEVYGIALDYCVLGAIEGIFNIDKNVDVSVVIDATESVANDSRAKAIEKLNVLGVKFVTTADVTNKRK